MITSRLNALLVVIALSIFFHVTTARTNADVIYNANDAFVSNELGAETNPFAPFSVGHFDEATLGGFTAFSGAEHFDSWYGSPAIQGYYIPNGINVPAALVNTDTVNPATTSFGAVVDPSQILLHPGGIGSGTTPPFHNAILRFTAPSAGVYLIDGDWESLDDGLTRNLILHNGTTLFSSTTTTSTFNFSRLLNVGDTVDFVVNDEDGSIISGSTGLRAVLTSVLVLGDANGDGVFNNLDIASFVLALTDQKAYQAMFPDVDTDVVLDMNCDGVFDNLDIAGFVAALTGK